MAQLTQTPAAATSDETVPTFDRDEALAAIRDPGNRPLDVRGISLVGEDLEGIDLTGCNLAGADLSEANLSHAKISHVDLSSAVLFGANLDGAELLGANLSCANLSECSARRAGLGHTDLSGANLYHADLEGATLSAATLKGAELWTTNLEGARIREANLGDASFTRARLRGADLGKSDVRGAHFENADLRETRLRALHNFEQATWIGADIRDVDFSGAYLLRRFILDENYLFEFRSRSRWAGFAYKLWWLTSDCGRSLVRWSAWVGGVAILFGILYLFVDLDYGSHRTVLSPFYFSFVTLTTLGYGDVAPASAVAQVLATCEVLLGYLGLGGLLSILANRMARRAD